MTDLLEQIKGMMTKKANNYDYSNNWRTSRKYIFFSNLNIEGHSSIGEFNQIV